MTRLRTHLASISAILFAMLAAVPARAASLVQVNNWNGGVSLPSDVTMYIYVPNAVATNPPILTLIHYCGGTASSVFGQAQGGGVVSAADKYGFIIVAPSSGRCWDVESTKAFTRDGGGDSHAIAQMVRYTTTQYKANADRVYSTGDSSGGMMTELLLALYPDIFKGGSAFAGIPAGCRGTNETGTTYSGQCAGGSVTHTAADWGTIVKNMDSGYTGHRPRVQLFHGSADTTINYTNFTEAIKEWSNVLGLSTTPTTTVTGLTLGSHQATRQEWTNSCGFLVLDAFESIGGDHGPSDCLFDSTYVIPFLGLDKTGAVDPEIAQCGSGGAAGTGGATSTGGTTSAGGANGTGGASAAATGGRSGATGGETSGVKATGGMQATGGAQATGGTPAAGGRAVVGGNPSSGGTYAAQTGGSPAAGGATATGGNLSTGEHLATGGSLGLAGSAGGNSSVTTPPTGGLSAYGGKGAGGNSAAVGGDTEVNNSAPGTSGNTGSCSCAVVGGKKSPTNLLALALGAVLIHLMRRKR